MKKVNGQKVYYQHYYANVAQNRYRHAREVKGAMKEKLRIRSINTFGHTYKLQHVDAVVLLTKTNP